MNTEILILEQESFHIDLLRLKLQNFKAFNIVACKTVAEALAYMSLNKPDLIMIDFDFEVPYGGVQFAKQNLNPRDVPFIFLCSNYVKDVVNIAVSLQPSDILPKTVPEFDLSKSIRLSLAESKKLKDREMLDDIIYVRLGKDLRKISRDSIEYISVDGKYLNLYSKEQKYSIRATINEFILRLPKNFVKIHQSFVINLNFLDSIDLEEWNASLGKYTLPFSRNFKKDLFDLYYFS